jgi:hypothetical protein
MRNDPGGEFAATAAAHRKIIDLDKVISEYIGDHNGLRDLKMRQADLVRVHGRPST